MVIGSSPIVGTKQTEVILEFLNKEEILEVLWQQLDSYYKEYDYHHCVYVPKYFYIELLGRLFKCKSKHILNTSITWSDKEPIGHVKLIGFISYEEVLLQ